MLGIHRILGSKSRKNQQNEGKPEPGVAHASIVSH
jgi:hypothetical protein